jgi:hypothetical protein
MMTSFWCGLPPADPLLPPTADDDDDDDVMMMMMMMMMTMTMLTGTQVHTGTGRLFFARAMLVWCGCPRGFIM